MGEIRPKKFDKLIDSESFWPCQITDVKEDIAYFDRWYNWSSWNYYRSSFSIIWCFQDRLNPRFSWPAKENFS